MGYRVEISGAAERQLKRMRDRRAYERVRDAIRQLGSDPRPHGARKLSGQEAWRIRVGEIRIIYTIEDDVLVVSVIRVGHRSDVYRD